MFPRLVPRSRTKILATGFSATALSLIGLAWSVQPAQAGYSIQYITDPLNTAFTQALGINNSSTIVGYGNQTVFNGFQLVLP